MKKLLLVIILILVSTIILAGSVGDRCEYPVYQDTECNDTNNIYCINYACAFYDGTAPFCSDTDGDDSSIFGTVNYIFRDSVGKFVEENYGDYCSLMGSPIGSCEGTDCNVVEFYCTVSRTINYSSKNYFCENGCEEGKCLPQPEPILPQIGDPCSSDADCNASGLYCVNNFCATEPETIIDSPIDNNPPDANEPIDPVEFPPEDEFPPKSVNDEKLLEYVDMWANGELTDEEIQTIIEIWKEN